jgi:cytochrome b561
MNNKVKKYFYYFTAFLALSSSLGVIVSSIIIWFILPRGIGQHNNEGRLRPHEPDCTEYCNQQGLGPYGNVDSIFDWPRYLWVEYHSWISIILVIVILIHIFIHWDWFVDITKRIINNIKQKRIRITERYITASILFILFLFECLSGFVIWLIMPRGRDNYFEMIEGIGRTFWGLQRDVWSDLHAWVAIVIVAIVILHIAMHWRWVIRTTAGEKRVEEGTNH